MGKLPPLPKAIPYGATDFGVLVGTAHYGNIDAEKLKGTTPDGYRLRKHQYRVPRALTTPVGASTVSVWHWIRRILQRANIDQNVKIRVESGLRNRHASMHFDLRERELTAFEWSTVDTCSAETCATLQIEWRKEMEDKERATAGAAEGEAQEQTENEAAANEAEQGEAAGTEAAGEAEAAANAEGQAEAEAAAEGEAQEQAPEA